ncbi:SigE family RNA polymerase sigma factor [Catellatospora coxensis]
MDRYDGFHEFVVERGGALSRTAFLLTGEHHAAEDLVQSALAKAATRWRQIMDYGQPEAYIRRTMINEQISWWRRRPARPVAEVPERAGPDEPGRVVERVALGQALATLTPRQRTVVVLRFYEDLSEADTAALMGCSVGTVKSQTHLALGHLRRALPRYAEQAGSTPTARPPWPWPAAAGPAGRSRPRCSRCRCWPA